MKCLKPTLRFWAQLLCVFLFLGVAVQAAPLSASYTPAGLQVAPAWIATSFIAGQPASVWETSAYNDNTIVSDYGYTGVGFNGSATLDVPGYYSTTNNGNGGTFTLYQDMTICVTAFAVGYKGSAVDQNGYLRITDGSGNVVFLLDRATTGAGTGFRSFNGRLWQDDCVPGPGPEARYNHKSLAGYGADMDASGLFSATLEYRQNLVLTAGTYTVTKVQSLSFRPQAFIVMLPKPPEVVPPTDLKLRPDPTSASASLNASPTSLVLGETLTLTLGETLAAPSGRHLDGPGLSSNPLADPASIVSATPASAGTANYSYTVPGGSVKLTWLSDSPIGTFTLHLPDSSTVDVTAKFFYDTKVPGEYYITQTNSAGSLDSPKLTVSLPADAVATASVTVLPAPTVNLSLDSSSVIVGNGTVARSLAGPAGAVASHALEYRVKGGDPTWKLVQAWNDAGGAEQSVAIGSSLALGNYEFRARAARSSGPTAYSSVVLLELKAQLIVTAPPPSGPPSGVPPLVNNPPLVPPVLIVPVAPPPQLPPPPAAVASVAVGLRLLASSELVSAPGTGYDGQRYKRAWFEGSVNYAYLGRSGVRFEAAGSGLLGAGAMQLQAKSPEAGAQWQDLATGQSAGVQTGGVSDAFVCGFSVRLGEVQGDAPLVPRSYAEGHALTGQWLFRARVSDSVGVWSVWSEELLVQVVLPLSVKAETLQTLPPAGVEGEWFSASAPKTFRIGLWIP